VPGWHLALRGFPENGDTIPVNRCRKCSGSSFELRRRLPERNLPFTLRRLRRLQFRAPGRVADGCPVTPSVLTGAGAGPGDTVAR
jgi:hypothetical protein